MLLPVRVLALLPDPNQLVVVTAAAAVVDGQLLPRAKASAVLPATSLCLSPSSVVHAAAHALIRAAANAKIRVECPSQLRASEK